MEKIDIRIPGYPKQYPVIIGANILEQIAEYVNFERYSSIFIFADSNVAPLYAQKLQRILSDQLDNISISQYIFEAGEKNKNMTTVEAAYKALVKSKADRRTLMINLGGGVVSDLGGFIASTFLRGISFMTIPTTLESMVDASVGGKTGINFENLKNYIGVFASPEAIIIDVDTLKTMPERAYIQGFAEAIKHGLIQDISYYNKIYQKKPTMYSPEELMEIIRGSVQIKADIVQQDPHEKGIRKILNFGHTVGHVLESLSLETEQPLFHGEAVAIGMIAEAYISKCEGMLTEEEFKEVEKSINNAGLPTRFKTTKPLEHMIQMLYTDKKTEKGSVKWTLLSGIGRAEFNIVVNEKFAKEGLAYILS